MPSEVAERQLTFKWHDGTTFALDIGGIMLGGEKSGETFVGEVKNYKNASDLSTHYDSFLAKCYLALKEAPRSCNNFLWISWAPHRANTWDAQTSPETIKTALIKHKQKVFGVSTKEQADAAIGRDESIITDLSSRLMPLVISDQQIDHLSMSVEHLGVLRRWITENPSS